MTTYRYLTAAEWGMRWARPPIAEKQPDTECFIHHTAGGQLSPDAAQAFRLLNEYAINQKGYSALDYDVVVHYNASLDICTIGEGRGPWLSAATLDRNEYGEAVCVLGYFHPGHSLSRRPHPAEVEGTALGVEYGMLNGWISPGAVILGHRDNPAHIGATGCPGDYLQAEIPTIRQRVAELTSIPQPEERPVSLKPHNMPIYDSRSVGAALAPGVAVPIAVGGDTATQAVVRLEVLSPVNPGGGKFAEGGYVAVNDAKAAQVNWFAGDQYRADTAFVGLWHGVLTVTPTASCHLVLSVQGIG